MRKKLSQLPLLASMAIVPSILGVDKQLAGFEGAVAVEIKSSTSISTKRQTNSSRVSSMKHFLRLISNDKVQS